MAASADDAEEWASGGVTLTSSDLEFTYEGTAGNTVGMRFNGITVPQGAAILDAWLQFQVDEANSVATNLTIQGQADDNPGTFVNTSFGVSSRPRTDCASSRFPARRIPNSPS